MKTPATPFLVALLLGTAAPADQPPSPQLSLPTVRLDAITAPNSSSGASAATSPMRAPNSAPNTAASSNSISPVKSCECPAADASTIRISLVKPTSSGST